MMANPPDASLAAAAVALDDGDVMQARELAQSVLFLARNTDLHLEARALACLAHCDRIDSRLRRASETSRRAAQIFEQLGDVDGEANALTTLTHVCMLLGRNDEAVDAALLGVRLCGTSAPNTQVVLAYNSLGLAYSWSGDHDRADATLEMAVQVALRCVPPVSASQPRLNQMWVEASRLLDERYQTGVMRSLDRLEQLAAECAICASDGQGALLPGLQPMGRTIWSASSALLLAGRATSWRPRQLSNRPSARCLV